LDRGLAAADFRDDELAARGLVAGLPCGDDPTASRNFGVKAGGKARGGAADFLGDDFCFARRRSGDVVEDFDVDGVVTA
jgi:hypothetical protein